jgi:glucoamylase
MAVERDLAQALDATGRRFAFRPAAVLGNGSLLATISARGEVERLFWPNVDHGQHLGELRVGLELDGTVAWLDEEPFTWEQSYADGSSLLSTAAHNGDLSVHLTDLLTPGEPVLVRGVRCSGPARLVVRSAPSLDGDPSGVAGYVDPATGALVFYQRGVALAVALIAPDAAASLREGEGAEVTDDVVVHRAPVEGSLSGRVDGGEALVLTAFGATPAEAIARLARPASVGFDVLASERVAYDREAIALAAPVSEGIPGLEALYGRSLLVLEQLTDRQTGATIAAPEFDPNFEQSGGYGFVWPRDLGYVVLSFLAAGRGDLALPALRWLAREQAPEGLWLQRYWTDGSLAPSWGLHQLDETGMVVFAYEAAWRALQDAALDRELWPSARAAGDFLCGFLDEETGLPLPSVDLWEQTDGQHSYSAAATYGGLAACAAMAARHEPALATR